MKTSEPKPTKEEILNKHLNKLPPEYVTYIPKRERDARQYTLDAMQEYAEQFHKEKTEESFPKEEEINKLIFELWLSQEDKRDPIYNNGVTFGIKWVYDKLLKQ